MKPKSAAQREAAGLKLRAQRKTGGAAEDTFLERADALLREDQQRRQTELFIKRMARVNNTEGWQGIWFMEAQRIARKLAKDRRG